LFKRASPTTPDAGSSVRASGVITGIRFAPSGDAVSCEFAVTVPDRGARFGVRARPLAAHRLHLGAPVLLKDERNGAVFDWSAMTAGWGRPDELLAQEPLKKLPDDGLVDTALDERVQRHLKRWSPVSTTIVSMTRRRTAADQPSMHWDVELELLDG